MNTIVLCGRLTKDTAINQSGKVADNCIAVDRPLKDQNGNKQTDFINVRWIGEKKAQFAEKYMTKGIKVIISGRLQIDNYKDRNGNSRQFAYVLINEVEFAESKASSDRNKEQEKPKAADDSFMKIPDGVDSELPFD